MKNPTLRWQLAAFIFTSAAGTLLHYAYDWSGGIVIFAPFSGVNESTWEHMKLFFWPAFIFSFAESYRLEQNHLGFWCAKLGEILTGLFFIPALFYTYTGSFGMMIDWINISIFFISAAIACLVGGHLLEMSVGRFCIPWAAILVLCLIGAAFIYFTFYPPLIPLFQDPLTGSYGI